MVPDTWIIPVAFLTAHAMAGAVLGAFAGWLFSLLAISPPRSLLSDSLTGGLGAVAGRFLVAWVQSFITFYINGRAVDGWHAFVVNHDFALIAIFVVAVVALRKILAASQHAREHDAT